MITRNDIRVARKYITETLTKVSNDREDYETLFAIRFHVGDQALPALPMYGRHAAQMQAFLLRVLDLLEAETKDAREDPMPERG